jgi:hypothetical protein
MSDTRPPPSGDWLLTFSGHKFYPLDPRPEAICLQDIAHALAHICRWTGHVNYHYSVAQHAVQVALAVEQMAPDLALLALHHDDAEAYLGDIARPWKRNLRVTRSPHDHPTVEDVESEVLGVILEALGVRVPADEAWDVIRVADNRVLQAEAEALMPKHPEFPTFGRKPIACLTDRMWPDTARDTFLLHHNRLSALAALA